MRAIIIGHSGQDGRLLFEYLKGCGYEALGFSRSSVRSTSKAHWIPKSINLFNRDEIYSLIESFLPLEIYYLPAYHSSSEESVELGIGELYIKSHQTHVIGLLTVLCAIKDICPSCKLFYASSSLVFSGCPDEIQSETTPLSPRGVYALTKANGMLLCREFRENLGIFASAGILYNHESCLRPSSFLSQKIILSAFRIASGEEDHLIVGNLSTKVDWSYANDVVRAFPMILALDESQDFIISSGEAHSVFEFVKLVFEYFDLRIDQHVIEDSSILKRTAATRIGNNNHLQKSTGWKPSMSFKEMVYQLIIESLPLYIHSKSQNSRTVQ